VTIVNPSALTVINMFFWVLLLGAFVIEVWAFADALRRPSDSFKAAGKQTKPIWLIILGVAFVIGIAGAVGYLPLLSIFPIAAFVAAAIYLADVRPKIKSLKSGTRQGPYGPW
jgi:predicted membrane metal-binding protein